MRFCSKPLAAALSIAAIAAVTMASPGHAQQDPGAGPPPAPPPGAAPEMRPPDGPPPRHFARRAGGAALVSANVNLRSGPGTDSEILATIPAGSTVHVGKCEGEWCAVTWNGQNGYAIARNLNTGGPRQAGVYPRRPGYQPGYPDDDGLPGYAPGYAYGPPVVYGPAYYYGPRAYYYGGWGWRRHGW